ncbi:MAG: LPS export ABC transporter periplasmic protein LptC [Treponemataceae bacterium]
MIIFSKKNFTPLYSVTLLLFLFFEFAFFSCSLNYSNAQIESSKAPDLIFENIKLTKIERGIVKAQIQAEKLEQYSRDNSSFAQNIKFKLFNGKSLISFEGKCGLLGIYSDEKIYTMFDDIQIFAYEQNMMIKSEALRWNNASEQLSSPKAGLVTISNDFEYPGHEYAKPAEKKTNVMNFSGTGFSASGVTQSYSFAKNMKGEIDNEVDGE